MEKFSLKNSIITPYPPICDLQKPVSPIFYALHNEIESTTQSAFAIFLCFDRSYATLQLHNNHTSFTICSVNPVIRKKDNFLFSQFFVAEHVFQQN